jgi:hypothetical protein
MNRPVNLLVVHNGKNAENPWAMIMANMVAYLDFPNNLQFIPLSDVSDSVALEREPDRTVVFRDDPMVKRWRRESCKSRGLPPQLYGFKACYVVNPDFLGICNEDERKVFAAEIKSDIAVLYGEDAKAQSAIMVPPAVLAPRALLEEAGLIS